MKPSAAVLLSVFLVAPAAQAAGLFERKQAQVEEGNRAFSEQHFQQALEAYEQAEQQLQQEPRLHFDRGGALYKLGRHKEARESFLRAMGMEESELKKQNLFNIGNTFLAEGALNDAAAYFRRALELDPHYDDARYNLELVLRAQQQQQKQNSSQKEKSPQENQPEQQQQKENQQQQQNEQQGEQQQSEQKEQQGEQKEQQQEKQQQQQGEQQKQQQGEQQKQQEQQSSQGAAEKEEKQQSPQEQAGQPRPQEQQQAEANRTQGDRQPERAPETLSAQQIQALLQAMKDNEKPFQLYRFALPEFHRRKVEKEW